MVALAYTDIIYTDAPAPPPAPRPKPAPKKSGGQRAGTGSDPLVDMTARLLSVPFREVYALLWRAGVLSVDA